MKMLALTAVPIGAMALSLSCGCDPGCRVNMLVVQINTFENALAHFLADHNRYPTTEEGLQILAVEGYLEKDFVPKDPWGGAYVYFLDEADPGRFTVISYGKDGKPGGKGYSTDVSNHTIAVEVRRREAKE